MAEAVADGEQAARERDWNGVSTANIHFHRELVALAGSARTDELMRSVFAELRLAFHAVDDPAALHEPYPRPQPRDPRDPRSGATRTDAERLLAATCDDSRVAWSRPTDDGCPKAKSASRAGRTCRTR